MCVKRFLLSLALSILFIPVFSQSQSEPATTAEQTEQASQKETTPATEGILPEKSLKLDNKKAGEWKKETWMKLAFVTGAALIAYNYDENIQRWSQNHQGGSAGDNVVKAVKPLGNGLVTMPLLAGFYLLGRHYGNERMQETSALGVESFVLSEVLVQFLKYGTHRERPSESQYSDKRHNPSFKNEHLSFASGEACAAFSVATIFATEYSDKKWVPPLSYGLATIAALGRVHDNGHWASDVIVGSSIGYFMSKAIYHHHHSRSAKNMTFMPIVGNNKHGLLVALRF